jgi:hypothetical protein
LRWRAAHGDWRMVVSNDLYGELRSRFGIHANIDLPAAHDLYGLWPDPRLLLVLTSVACFRPRPLRDCHNRLSGSLWTLLPPAALPHEPDGHDANLYDFHVTTDAALLVAADDLGVSA